MALDQDIFFIAQNEDIGIYNAVPLINFIKPILNKDGTPFSFPGYVSSYFAIYQARGQSQLKMFTTQITRSSNNLFFNCSVSDMTFNDIGKYYYELGYVQSGGYSIPLRYGDLTVQ